MSKPLVYEECQGIDGEPMLLPVMPDDASLEQMEDIITAEGGAVMTDEQQAAFDKYINEGVTPDGRIR